MARKAILIGLDGATWTLLRPLIEDGFLPHFDEFVHDGVSGILRAPIPPNTLTGWTSIFTGVNPGKHGVTDFVVFHEGKFTTIRTELRMCSSLWRLTSRRGLKCIVVNEPVTFPPEPVNGFMVTGFLTPPRSSNYVYPLQAREEVEKASGGYKTDIQVMIARSREEALGMLDEHSEKVAKVALHFSKHYSWHLLAAIFTSTDRLQHFFWGDVNAIKRHYQKLDQLLAKFMNLASSEEANLLMVSDHGFSSCSRAFYVNAWLAEKGYLKIATKSMEGTLKKVGLTRRRLLHTSLIRSLYRRGLIHKIPKRIRSLLPASSEIKGEAEWSESLAYQPSTGGIFLNEARLGGNLSKFKQQLVEELMSVRDPETGKLVVEKCLTREEVYWGPYVSRAPHILIIPSKDVYVFPRITEYIFGRPPSRGDFPILAEHDVNGILAAWGPDIERGMQLQRPLMCWNIAPTILHLLGLPVLSYMDGRVLRELFAEGSGAQRRPVKVERGLKEILASRLERLSLNKR